MKTDGELIETLASSEVYKDYERAYGEAVGLPLALRPVEQWQMPLHGKRRDAPFCALIATRSEMCATCLRMGEKLCQSAKSGGAAITCDYGICEIAIPVQLGNRAIGFLHTGQVLRKKPSRAQFNRIAADMEAHGLKINRQTAEQAYFKTPVFSQKKLDSATRLLAIFAEHLAIKSNEIAMRKASAEPPAITNAKRYIQEHYREELSLCGVAAVVHVSAFYFCKMFKKATGMNFTEFVSRTRVEKAKQLLLNRNLRISEIAYEVGFQSLTHFNRIFRQLMGQSPTEYRCRAPGI